MSADIQKLTADFTAAFHALARAQHGAKTEINVATIMTPVGDHFVRTPGGVTYTLTLPPAANVAPIVGEAGE